MSERGGTRSVVRQEPQSAYARLPQWTSSSCGPCGPRGRHRPGQAMQFKIDRLNASGEPDDGSLGWKLCQPAVGSIRHIEAKLCSIKINRPIKSSVPSRPRLRVAELGRRVRGCAAETVSSGMTLATTAPASAVAVGQGPTPPSAGAAGGGWSVDEPPPRAWPWPLLAPPRLPAQRMDPLCARRVICIASSCRPRRPAGRQRLLTFSAHRDSSAVACSGSACTGAMEGAGARTPSRRATVVDTNDQPAFSRAPALRQEMEPIP